MLLSRSSSGFSCSRPSGGRASFPEAAHMSVPPSLVHLCPGQHPSGSPGRHPTQVGRGTKKGAFFGFNVFCLSACWCHTAAVAQFLISEHVVCRSCRCAAHQQRRRSWFSLTHESQMCYCFPSTDPGMWGMPERQTNPLCEPRNAFPLIVVLGQLLGGRFLRLARNKSEAEDRKKIIY